MNSTLLLNDLELKNYSNDEIVFALLSAASEMNVSYACWKLPKIDALNVLIDFSEKVSNRKTQLDASKIGFVLQSFIQNSAEETKFLNADLYFSSKTKALTIGEEPINPSVKEQFLMSFIKKLTSKNFSITLQKSEYETIENSKISYKNLIEKAKEAILENRFKKIVLSRCKSIDALSLGDSLSNRFKELTISFPNALVSLVHTKETGTWLTASPEILASIDQEGIFKTIALAGTQQLQLGDSLQKAVWSQKEIEEQALVSRYIINCFKKIRLREYEEEGPRTVQSGNLLHLRTDYTVNTKEVNFPELGTVMLELLHPTSAVCGMPKEVTLEFIKEHEGFDRKLFSGYLGPINIDGASHIFVNLRCAHLFADRAVLYAGAGVTQDSEPEKEFLETEMKMDAVGRFLVS